MSRPYVISIAGFDPSAGAGILADVKCFEQHKVYGFGVCTSLTVQNDVNFMQVNWLPATQIIDQLSVLLIRFQPTVCKIGLIENIEVLLQVIKVLKESAPDVKIVLDPVLGASAGFEFHDWNDALPKLTPVLNRIDLITPNYNELQQMSATSNEDVYAVAKEWSAYCAVLLKGGHNKTEPGTDYLFEKGSVQSFRPRIQHVYPKHGSGCVLSSAIAAHLALGKSMTQSCRAAKPYIEQFLNSNTTLLGYHKL